MVAGGAVCLLLVGATPAAGATVRTLARDGHPTTPVWYHDTTAVGVGRFLYLAWNTNRGAVQVRAFDRSAGAWAGSAVQVSVANLDCHCVDSTGTNPNRHDVPALFADPAGRVYALYGGGTASKTEPTGPYFRAATRSREVASWDPERRLEIPGAAYDFEVVRDNLGVSHIIGQQGDNRAGAGSLVYMRFLPGDDAAPGSFAAPGYRVLVRGGYDPAACAWRSSPGCDVFVIGRLASGPADPVDPGQPSPLYVVWGWSEGNLSNTCGDPSGFCNHGLYAAVSLDGGGTWSSLTGTASTDLTTGPIPYDDSRYAVVPGSENVGLFKAVAVTGPYPGTPWIAYQPGANVGAGAITIARFDSNRSGGSWVTQTVDTGRSWNNHLVMRGTAAGAVYLWSDIAQTGTNAGDLAQWRTNGAGDPWTRTALAVGPNWFLTGRPVGRSELLVWRAGTEAGATRVAFTLVRL